MDITERTDYSDFDFAVRAHKTLRALGRAWHVPDVLLLRKGLAYVPGRFFFGSMVDSLAAASEYSGKDGYLLSAPDILEHRLLTGAAGSDGTSKLLSKPHSPLSKQSHYQTRSGVLSSTTVTSSSEEYLIKDVRGRLGLKHAPYVMVVHGGGVLCSPGCVSYRKDNPGAPLFDVDAQDALLQGKLPGGVSFELFTLEDLVKGKHHHALQYGVVLPLRDLSENNGLIPSYSLLEDPLFLARCGDQYLAETVVRSAPQKVGFYTHLHALEMQEGLKIRFVALGDEPSVFMGAVPYGGYARFAAITAEHMGPIRTHLRHIQ